MRGTLHWGCGRFWGRGVNIPIMVCENKNAYKDCSAMMLRYGDLF